VDAKRLLTDLRRRFSSVQWKKVLLGTGIALVVIAVVPPFRNAAAAATSRVILFAASPLAPDIDDFDALPGVTRILAADGSVLAELDGGQRREPVKLDALPEHVPHAVLAAEDKNFYDHGGVDPSAVFRALLRNAQGKTQGGSTITQQLAKINYTNSERTVMRKLKEVLYASELENKYSKDELLERYLNQVYFGDGAYGIAAASESYFGVPPEKLTEAQAALLAGMIKAPEGYDPRGKPDKVKPRRDVVLRNMGRNGWLAKDKLEAALATPVEVAPPSETKPPSKAPHFVEYVKREALGLEELGSPEARANSLNNGQLTIKTTLDPRAFDAATNAVTQQLGAPGDPATAVVSVKPGDGAITNLFGGLSFERQFDVASQGHRQPGSSFKPFVYLAALRSGIDPRSVMDASSPMKLEYRGSSFEVSNYEGAGGGTSTIENAMVHSINTVFSQLVLEVQPANAVKTARDAGINEALDADRNNPAVALGGVTKGVTPLEMAAAYATFASGGVYAEPYSITEIADREGKVVYRAEPETGRVFNKDEVGVLNRALIGVVERGTGRAAQIGRPAAGKTGTTQNYGDAWFVGFVPQMATAVWVGDPEKITPMTNVHGRSVSGGSFPATIWSLTMRTALADVPAKPIFTASPDSLNLRMLSTTTSSTTTSSTSSTSTTSTTEAPAKSTTSTTQKPKPKPTTTTSSTSTTSTTVKTSSGSGGGGSGGD
jgi:penicillin-binding protein 1A